MYTNLAKSPAIPLAMRVSSQPSCLKLLSTARSQYLPIGSRPKPPQRSDSVIFAASRYGSGCITTNMNFSTYAQHNVVKLRDISSVFWLRTATQNSVSIKGRSFSNWSTQSGQSTMVRAGKELPWLGSSNGDKVRIRNEKPVKSSRSSWEVSAKRMEKVSSGSSWEESAKRLDRQGSGSSWDEYKKSGTSLVGSTESRNRMVDVAEDHRSENISRDVWYKENLGDEKEEAEAVNDPRWNKLKNKYRGVVDVKDGYEKPEFRRWNKQENWGRKTWKEASESTVPKMVGEGIYGVGPILAALSSGRREFYALYIQEGLDLSSNNRKKKDKKGFEKVLKMAEKIGLSTKEVSKHDLNMVVDNRPHQGLVLDASPLEMVKIEELEPVSLEEEKNSLWVALDEVTDPQNLGAIIRSAYFFGASGVVLCAKNSAPLSGVVSKASAGSLELMELRYCKNMMQFLTSSAENGWRVLGGSVSSKAIPLNEVVPGAPTILVLGSEGTGLRPLVERSCTQLVRIPWNVPVDLIPGEEECIETVDNFSGGSAADFQSFLAVESLNVSVAAGVLLHHLIGNEYYKNDSGMVDQQNNALG
ncbi:RNA methyltransferase TrmH family [Parasponia andersonii]|uniref:rRNA methyltransferase 1, mitochondrial n=1 Tax=Parasponia andersonii TaxID=3476 RepID=A0A2P5B8T3_PARAD|nr:RNA methyltransferase TrmH family [Parasponia andersonii]